MSVFKEIASKYFKHGYVVFVIPVMVYSLSFGSMVAESSEISDLASDLVKPILSLSGKHKIAVSQIDRSKSKISAGLSQMLVERITNSIQQKIGGSKISLMERARIEDIMKEQEEFQDVEEFSKLLAGMGADIVIFPTVARVDDKTIELSARSVGVSQKLGGKVLSASNPVRIDSPISYTITVVGVKYGDAFKENYKSSLISGLSKIKGIKITQDASVYSTDFKATSNLEFDITTKETVESKEAKQGQNVLKAFSGAFGSIGGNNPLSGVMGSIAKSTNPDDLKLKIISVTVETKLVNVLDKSIISVEESGEKEVPFTASKSALKSGLKSLVKSILQSSGEKIAARLVGVKVTKNKKAGLLD